MRLRLPLFSCSLILAVAACGGRDPVANGANQVTALPAKAIPGKSALADPNPTGAPPANATTPAEPTSAPAATIPAAFHGRWGLAPGDCTSALGDAKGLLVINGGELRFYESRAVPAPGVHADPGSHSVSGNFRFTGEGQTWTKFETLQLQKDRLVRTESNAAASYTYAKC